MDYPNPSLAPLKTGPAKHTTLIGEYVRDVCMRAFVCVCVCVCVCEDICLYVYMSVFVCICEYVCLNVHVCVLLRERVRMCVSCARLF